MQEEDNPKTKGTFRHSGRTDNPKTMEHFDIQEEDTPSRIEHFLKQEENNPITNGTLCPKGRRESKRKTVTASNTDNNTDANYSLKQRNKLCSAR